MSDSDHQTDQTTDLDKDEDDIQVDEMTLLKQRADLLGIAYSPRIGIDSLKQKIARKVAGEPEEKAPAEEKVAAEPAAMSKIQREAKLRADMQTEHMKLVRLRITNLNPNKKDLHGEIFTVANRFLGNVKKYIPYGEATEDGYHVPHVIYMQLKTRKFLNIRTYRNKANGQIVVEQKWVPEFALEVLPQLDQGELNQLAASQAAAGGVS